MDTSAQPVHLFDLDLMCWIIVSANYISVLYHAYVKRMTKFQPNSFLSLITSNLTNIAENSLRIIEMLVY